jgi:hypothetical protein
MRKLFKVKVDPSTLDADQSKNGYLAAFGQIVYYSSLVEANRKAKLFGGKTELVDTPLTKCLAQLTMSQVSVNTISQEVLGLMEERNAFFDSQPTNDVIYQGDVFVDILTEINEGKLLVTDENVLEELNLLMQLVTTDYLMVVDMPYVSA